MGEDEELKRIREKKLAERLTQATKSRSMPDKPIVVTDITFTETVQSYPLVVIDCWASWCGPCSMVGPILDELAGEYAGRILFGKLNVDENRKVPTQHEIMSIPTLLVFKEGKLVDRIIGALPKQMLEQKITRYL